MDSGANAGQVHVDTWPQAGMRYEDRHVHTLIQTHTETHILRKTQIYSHSPKHN